MQENANKLTGGEGGRGAGAATSEETVYLPDPIDTSEVQLNDEIVRLTELLAKNTHEVWARQRMSDGWRYGPHRDDARKEHPGLVPYEQLTDGEQEYDRNTALETLKVILALGYSLELRGNTGEDGNQDAVQRPNGNKPSR